MKFFLIIFLSSLAILLLVFLLNIATYNGVSDPSKKISNEKKS